MKIPKQAPIPTVELNGVKVPIFGSLETKLCVVSLDVLQRLTSMLPIVPLEVVKQGAIENIENANTMEEFTYALEEELRFHRSVNDIKEYTTVDGSF